MRISPVSTNLYNSVNINNINKNALIKTNTISDSVTFSGKKEPILDYENYEFKGICHYDENNVLKKVVTTDDAGIIVQEIELQASSNTDDYEDDFQDDDGYVDVKIKKITNYNDSGKKTEEITLHPNSAFVYNIKEFNTKSGFMKEQSIYEDDGMTLSYKLSYNSKNGVLKEHNIYNDKNMPYLTYKMDPDSGKNIQTIHRTIDGLYKEFVYDFNTENGEIFRQTSFHPDSNNIADVLELDKKTGNAIKQTAYYENGNMQFIGTANPENGLPIKLETYSSEKPVRVSKTEFDEDGQPLRIIHYKKDGKTIAEIEDLSLFV